MKSNTTFMLHSPTYQQLLPTDSPRTSLVLMLSHPATRPRMLLHQQSGEAAHSNGKPRLAQSFCTFHSHTVTRSICLSLSFCNLTDLSIPPHIQPILCPALIGCGKTRLFIG